MNEFFWGGGGRGVGRGVNTLEVAAAGKARGGLKGLKHPLCEREIENKSDPTLTFDKCVRWWYQWEWRWYLVVCKTQSSINISSKFRTSEELCYVHNTPHPSPPKKHQNHHKKLFEGETSVFFRDITSKISHSSVKDFFLWHIFLI